MRSMSYGDAPQMSLPNASRSWTVTSRLRKHAWLNCAQQHQRSMVLAGLPDLHGVYWQQALCRPYFTVNPP